MIELNKIYNMDCLEGMKYIDDKSIDMILCDLPYGRTQNKWDELIPLTDYVVNGKRILHKEDYLLQKYKEGVNYKETLESWEREHKKGLWYYYNKIIKDDGVIVLFADGLFMADLMNSNRKMWKYNLVWDKVLTSGFLNANRQPLRQHEEICVFYKKQPTYNPQKTKGKPNHSKGKPKETANNNYGKFDFVDNKEELGNMKHPTSILRFQKPHPSKMLHPTEKSVECCEWLIKTFTNENDLVLDNCMGSGTTAIACINTNRNFIGFELDKEYCEIAKNRINKHIIDNNLQDRYNLIT